MSLKARLRIAIVALVTLVVVAMSMLYLYDFTNFSFRSAFDRAPTWWPTRCGQFDRAIERDANG